MADSGLFLGIDMGTSGLRAICIDKDGEIVASANGSAPQNDADALRRPSLWRDLLNGVLSDLVGKIDPARIDALSVDGQSGTVLLCDQSGAVVRDQALLYCDAPSSDNIAHTKALTGFTSSPLARGFDLMEGAGPCTGLRLLHQADWLAGLFTGSFNVSDHGNALKTGFDPAIDGWRFELNCLPDHMMPNVVPTGHTIGRVGVDTT